MRGPFANSRLALILRRWRGRFGIFAPRVAVRTHLPWHWRALSVVILLAVAMALAAWVYDAGRRFAGFDRALTGQEIETLQRKSVDLEKEVVRLRGLADASESRLQIERTAQQQLAHQIQSLEEENARLKDDLAVFETLAQSEGQEGSLSINRLRVEPEGDSASQYRYRMLVAMQGRSKEREFKGNLQLALSLQQQGHETKLLLPLAAEANSQQYHLVFKYFHRIDGTFQIPAGARLKSLEVRLLQNGALKASKIVTL